MDAELKQKWLAALRSGEYRQGKFTFQSATGFCCLGVLCVAKGAPARVPNGIGSNYPAVFGELAEDTIIELERMNDTLGKTFPEIASWIEANL